MSHFSLVRNFVMKNYWPGYSWAGSVEESQYSDAGQARLSSNRNVQFLLCHNRHVEISANGASPAHVIGP